MKQCPLQCNMFYSSATAPLPFAIRPSLMVVIIEVLTEEILFHLLLLSEALTSLFPHGP